MDTIGQGGPQSPVVFGWPCQQLVLEALSEFIPPARINAILHQTARHGRRVRLLPAAAMVWLVIAIGLWGDLDIPSIWRQVFGTLRALWLAVAGSRLASKSALCQARQRLGVRPLRRLFVQTAGPLAAPVTAGAFYKGMRVMGIDGVRLDLPDTAANRSAFGAARTRRNGEPVEAAYPQIHVVFLSETGTHTICEALAKPAKHCEYTTGRALLRKVPPDGLALWDRAFYGYRAVADAMAAGVHLLARVPAGVVFRRFQDLPDGSYLARIYPSAKHQRHDQQALIVRIIEYTLDDPARPGYAERHRLLTTLLDAQAYPALELVVLYHQRWEVEIGNDEIKTHQLDRLVELRSRTPCGVVQELYGILLAYNAVRFLMYRAAASVNIDPRQLSFIHAVRVIRETVPLMRAARPIQLPSLYQAMIAHIAAGRLPPRDNRINPRVVKRKMSNYAKKRPEHYHMPQPKTSFLQSVVLLN